MSHEGGTVCPSVSPSIHPQDVSIYGNALDQVDILGVFEVLFSEAESVFTLLIFIDFLF